MLRRLLVGSAQYIPGPFGEDSGLRRHGLAMRGKARLFAAFCVLPSMEALTGEALAGFQFGWDDKGEEKINLWTQTRYPCLEEGKDGDGDGAVHGDP